jgi:16S rRNA (cytosine967-C5)-methyltransferase
VLERVERAGAYADLALHAALRRSRLAPADRALATELVYGTLRWRGRLDFLLSRVLERDFDTLEPLVATLLRLGAYQIVFTRSVPDYAAVDQTVRCARAVGAERATGLVNGVLRRLARIHERIPLPDLMDDPVGHLTGVLSLPPWIAERWLEIFGAEEAAMLAKASNSVPPITARVNPLRSSRQVLIEELAPRLPDVRPCRLAPRGVVLGHRGHPAHDPAFLEGRFTIQDEASQLVVAYLEPKPGERILDVCAAPGTKTTAIAEEIGDAGEIVAVDRNVRRLRLVGREARTHQHHHLRARRHANPARIRSAGRFRPHPGRRALLGPRHPSQESRRTLEGAPWRFAAPGGASDGDPAKRGRHLETGRHPRLQYLHPASRGERDGGRGAPLRGAGSPPAAG